MSKQITSKYPLLLSPAELTTERPRPLLPRWIEDAHEFRHRRKIAARICRHPAGKEITILPIGAIAKGIASSPNCIRVWMKSGDFPQPSFKIGRCWWFSVGQIYRSNHAARIVINDQARRIKDSGGKISNLWHWQRMPRDLKASFFAEVWANWDLDFRPENAERDEHKPHVGFRDERAAPRKTAKSGWGGKRPRPMERSPEGSGGGPS